MLNTIQKTVCALAVLSATALPVMAESIDVRVIGTISPTACTPTLSGGGTADYGNINPNTLSLDAFTVLAEKQLDFSITCDAPAKLAIKATNARLGTVAGTTELAATGVATAPVNLFGKNGVGVVGLGLDGDKKIGGYAIRIAGSTVSIDGAKAAPLQSDNNGVSWTVTTDDLGSIYGRNSVRWNSWAVDGSKEPTAFTTLSGKLGVQAYINKASELDLSKPVVLDGLSTIELVYL